MQEALVYFIVLCAAIVAFRRYAPKTWRERLRSAWISFARRLGFKMKEPERHVVQRVSLDALKRSAKK